MPHSQLSTHRTCCFNSKHLGRAGVRQAVPYLTFPERLAPTPWTSPRAGTVVIPVIDLQGPAADLMLVQVLHSLHGHRLVVVLAEGVALGLSALLVLHHPVEVRLTQCGMFGMTVYSWFEARPDLSLSLRSVRTPFLALFRKLWSTRSATAFCNDAFDLIPLHVDLGDLFGTFAPLGGRFPLIWPLLTLPLITAQTISMTNFPMRRSKQTSSDDMACEMAFQVMCC